MVYHKLEDLKSLDGVDALCLNGATRNFRDASLYPPDHSA